MSRADRRVAARRSGLRSLENLEGWELIRKNRKQLHLAASLCLAFISSAATAAAQYNFTILPPPSGFADDYTTIETVQGINNMGQVAGTLLSSGVFTPVRWTDGVGTVLPMPTGFASLVRVVGINDAGQVLGQVCPPTGISVGCRGVVWNGTTPTVIPDELLGVCPPSAAGRFNTVTGINRAGHVVGISEVVGCSSEGWIWDGSSFIARLTYTTNCAFPGVTTGAVTPADINDADHVVSNVYLPFPGGTSCGTNGDPALVIPTISGPSIHVLSVPVGSYLGVGNPRVINNLDQTFGFLSPTGFFFWNGSGYTEVSASAPPYFDSINNLGQLVAATGGTTLIVWQNGSQTDIPIPSPWLLENQPEVLNDAGQFAFQAQETVDFDQTLSRIMVLTPSPASCASDVSQQVTVARGGLRLNRATGRYVQTVTVTNNTSSRIAGPISLALDSLPNSASLAGLSGATGCAAPVGSAFLTLPSDLPANGGSLSITLNFIDTTNAPITYSTRVLAGPGGR
jgi:hypothetical protein